MFTQAELPFLILAEHPRKIQLRHPDVVTYGVHFMCYGFRWDFLHKTLNGFMASFHLDHLI